MNTKQLTHRLFGTIVALFFMILPLATMSASPTPPTPPPTNNPVPPANNPVEEEQTNLPLDLVDERPTAIGLVWNYSTQTVGWVWGALRDNVFSWIMPPTPTSLTSSISKTDANQLFKLLGYAGYKLKQIETDVGIIPGLNFKFGQTRELSEADYEYLDSQVVEWERTNPGIYATLQRKIIKTVMTVNQSGDYRVSILTVKLLPLPDVAFIMTPKQVFLGEESSSLMRAIQRVERGIRSISQDQQSHKN